MASKKKESISSEKYTTKITDFYTSPIKIKLIKENGVLKVKQETDIDISLLSSSVLLTPDASPNKDTANANTNNTNNYDQLSLKLAKVCTNNSPDIGESLSALPLPDDGSPIKSEHCYSVSPEPKSCHCKQILDPIEVVNHSTASLIPVTTRPTIQTETSQPKKRRGRKGRVKSATAVKTESQSKQKTSHKTKLEPDTSNKTITDYFPVRRSGRRCKSEIEKDRMLEYEDKVLSQCEDGLEVVDMEGKGRGVLSTKCFKKGDFVVEYSGDLIDLAESKDRENFYGMSTKYGCYMYYFTLQNKQYCIDATDESSKLGRLLNHSRNGNCCTKLIEIKNNPFLILIAARDIVKGEEMLYDYGDRSKESLISHPWLK